MVWGCLLADLSEANLVAKKKEAVLKAGIFVENQSWKASSIAVENGVVLEDKRMLEDERDSLSKDLSTKARARGT